MERTRQLTTFAIDGYQISATFADSRNTTALGHVKQILLSSFANNAAKHTHGDILAIHPNRSDNNSGGKPLCALKSSYLPRIDSLLCLPC
ncbi:hypothetical protein [Ruthenibacterium lactatiformans]|uniref:hypothetical protein n=1 Tax=Ruthenibacterium lactatiformans TaxID=1550024 RepID=UPI001FA7536D|nr:hypothetical protein [Ruthenibacterium lactatiformans]